MIEVCRVLKALVDRGAIEVGTDVGHAGSRSQPRSGSHSASASSAADAALSSMTSLLEAEEPYAPLPSGDGSEGEAEAEAVAGPVGRLDRSRRPVPDAFAGADNPPVVHADRAVGTGIGADPTESTDAATGDDSQDRGALLRLFSALKE
jgi:hypothetical protein